MKKILFSILLFTYLESFGAADFWKTEVSLNGTTYKGVGNPGNPNPNLQGAYLGNFTAAPVTINMGGSGVYTWENSGSDVSAATMFYRVYKTGSTPGSFQSLALTTYAALSNPGDEERYNYSSTTNLTPSGLSSAGNYTIEFYWQGTGSGASLPIYASNGGSNYKANFDVAVTALPVSLTNFTGKQISHAIELSWETTNEINNDFFNIQHSRDLKSWESIGSTKGNGNTEQKQAYGFTHSNPKTGNNYYRLKQVDLNGNAEFSKSIAVLMPSNPNLVIYPNPATDFINVSGIEEAAGLQVLNSSGQLISELSISENTTIPLKAIPNGIYFIRIFDKNSVQTKKIIVN
jgi:hypothetical protein